MSAHEEKRVAVITGASSGIGKAAALELARRGWHVIGVGRDPERTTAAEAEIRAAAPSAEVDMIRADLASLAGAAQAADEIASKTDRLDALLKDRKSTRLNSSHSQISYAVFCLKKKTEH